MWKNGSQEVDLVVGLLKDDLNCLPEAQPPRECGIHQSLRCTEEGIIFLRGRGVAEIIADDLDLEGLGVKEAKYPIVAVHLW